MEHTLSESGRVKFIPSLKMEKRPGFYCCGIPNPKGLARCPSCGAPAAASTFHDAEQVVMTFPLVARLLFAFGEWLKNLGDRIEGRK